MGGSDTGGSSGGDAFSTQWNTGGDSFANLWNTGDTGGGGFNILSALSKGAEGFASGMGGQQSTGGYGALPTMQGIGGAQLANPSFIGNQTSYIPQGQGSNPQQIVDLIQKLISGNG